jgi:hypothetical protein
MKPHFLFKQESSASLYAGSYLQLPDSYASIVDNRASRVLFNLSAVWCDNIASIFARLIEAHQGGIKAEYFCNIHCRTKAALIARADQALCALMDTPEKVASAATPIIT